LYPLRGFTANSALRSLTCMLQGSQKIYQMGKIKVVHEVFAHCIFTRKDWRARSQYE
jgi:hypothetical protein